MIHYFNPGHETAILNSSPFYHAPFHVVKMQQDLSFLPAWYAESGDFVLTKLHLPDDLVEFWSPLEGFPKIALTEKDLNHTESINKQEVSLWGVSPQSIHHFEEINERHNLNLKIPTWDPCFFEFTHRRKAAEYLSKMVDLFPFISSSLIPQFCTTLEEIESILKENHDISFLAKAPFSSSGRGLLWLPKGQLTRTERQILHGMIKKQMSVSIEKVVKKVVDFAMEFACDGQGNCQFIGYSLFETNDRGNYESNQICSQDDIIKKLTQYIPLQYLNQVKFYLSETISQEIPSDYKGFAGVDMLIYQENEITKLHPCLEINLRTNMGVLTIKMKEKYISEEAKGRFFIEFGANAATLFAKHRKLLQQLPAIFKNGKMRSGYFPLCPVTADTQYNAYLLLE